MEKFYEIMQNVTDREKIVVVNLRVENGAIYATKVGEYRAVPMRDNFEYLEVPRSFIIIIGNAFCTELRFNPFNKEK